MARKSLSLVVLAAGKGTRMKSRLPKVLHPLLGRPMLSYVLDLARALPADRRGVVVGHQWKDVAALFEGTGVEAIRQKNQRGTGHAVKQARRLFSGGGDTVVLSGDTPLLTAPTLRRLLSGHRRAGAVVTLLTTFAPDPTGYGRILRDGAGRLAAIVEEGDASPEQRRIEEINTGVYCFENRFLDRSLRRLKAANSQKELYLTDLVAIAVDAGLKVAGVRCNAFEETLGVNSREDLARAQEIMRWRKMGKLMRGGVTIMDPASTWIETGVSIGADTVILPRTMLEGGTRIGRDCRLGPAVRIRDSLVGSGANVKDGSVIEGSKLGKECQIGPFAHLRPGTKLAARVKVGNFVEVKNSSVGKGSKASHLSYIGDAEVGRDVNIGAGTITCNYDGARKWKTVIEDGVFVGSDTQLIAPVRVGKGALVGAGSTITGDVPAGSLALSRVPQENRAKRSTGRRKKSKS